MRLDVDLQRYLYLKLRCPVEQNKLSEEQTSAPAITFCVRSSEQDVFMSGDDLGVRDTEYDIEVYGQDVDAVDSIAESARDALNGFRGRMGLTTVLGGFVRDQDGDYVPKAKLATDEGLHVNSFVWRAIT